MPAELSKLTSRQAVVDAINECDEMGRDEFLKHYGYRRSRLYPLTHHGQSYDSKAIVGVAFGKQHGHALKSSDFSGGADRVLPILARLGFEAGMVSHPALELKIGATYFRKDLVERFGGQLQRGIWTPKEFPVVFLFSGQSGEQYGYQDGWTSEGVFQYTGEGQAGDMTFTPGNAAIRDHVENGEDLLLFEDLGKGKGVRYVGMFNCADWSQREGLDANGDRRTLIVFDLVPAAVIAGALEEDSIKKDLENLPSLDQMRKAAIDAARNKSSGRKQGQSKASWYERSQKVRDYVLRRADGVCEACDEPAPFRKRNGSPYLEPHHTQRLTDDGPDHPAWVGAICPNCHRRIHSGEDGPDWNKKLQDRIRQKEPSEH